LLFRAQADEDDVVELAGEPRASHEQATRGRRLLRADVHQGGEKLDCFRLVADENTENLEQLRVARALLALSRLLAERLGHIDDLQTSAAKDEELALLRLAREVPEFDCVETVGSLKNHDCACHDGPPGSLD